MHKQTVKFSVTRIGNTIRTGRTSIYQPKANFKGGSIKWYEDNPKQKKSVTGSRVNGSRRVRFPTHPFQYIEQPKHSTQIHIGRS